MEIIPVIDLMGGIVVRASGGNRKHYPPLRSLITQHIDPVSVTADLLTLYPFKKMYLADLDAIFHQQPAWHLYQDLRLQFPEVTWLIDAGIRERQLLTKLSGLGVKPILGSETLSDLSLLQDYQQSILSLDFQHGSFLGDKTLLQEPERWPEAVIAMNIDFIGGNKGVDIELLDTIKNLRPDVDVIAAGGVRNQQDTDLLELKGIAGALVASAIHDKKLCFE